ncbi:hypothetical protein GGI20_006072, partial [Coemansia sp. BCRC 34301]
SMYPAQPDLALQQAMMANQMSQLSLQQQPQQQSLQSTYNPFAQRQTMYLGSFQQQPQPQTIDQFSTFNAFGNNNNNGINNSGSGQQQFHQHQLAATTTTPNNNSNNNANFADFGVFQ